MDLIGTFAIYYRANETFNETVESPEQALFAIDHNYCMAACVWLWVYGA